MLDQKLILARQHNDAIIISIPARFTSIPQVLEMVDALLLLILRVEDTKNRVNKIACQ
jgi:ribose 5-phosphate isomerase B